MKVYRTWKIQLKKAGRKNETIYLLRPKSQRLFIFNESAPVNDCVSPSIFTLMWLMSEWNGGSLKIKAKQLEELQHKDQHPLSNRGNGGLKEVFAFQLVSLYFRLWNDNLCLFFFFSVNVSHVISVYRWVHFSLEMFILCLYYRKKKIFLACLWESNIVRICILNQTKGRSIETGNYSMFLIGLQLWELQSGFHANKKKSEQAREIIYFSTVGER